MNLTLRAVTLSVLIAGSAGTAPPAGAIRFEEIAQKAGLQFEYRNDARGDLHQVELMGGGVAVLDYNNDGCMDIFFTNGAEISSLRKTSSRFHNRLFRNNCDLTLSLIHI